jgi:DNA replication protein DnaC
MHNRLENKISEKMIKLNLSNMVDSYKIQKTNTNMVNVSFEDRLEMLLDSELDARRTKKINRLIKTSNMRLNASIENIDYSIDRGLNKGVMNTLYECNWIKNNHNIILTGATGTGKSYIACALGNRACELNYSVSYFRLPRLLNDIKLSKETGTYNKLMKQLKKSNVLILDDFALARLTISESRDLLEVIDDRINNGSCVFTSQIPPEMWYETFDDPTFADAIMDRIIHNSYNIVLVGPSMRKINKKV